MSMDKPVVLTPNALRQLTLDQPRQITDTAYARSSSIREAGNPSDKRGKQVRIARTVSNDFSYPSGESSKYEIELGEPSFDKTSLAGDITFTPYPSTNRFRVAGLLVAEEIEENALVYVRLCHGQWYIVRTGVSAFDIVVFEIVAANGLYSGEAPEADGGDCLDSTYIGIDSMTAEVVSYPCGKTSVPGQDAEGNIQLEDPIGWVDGRSADELIGRRGAAAYMNIPDEYGVAGTCEWHILSIDLFRERVTVVDVIKETDNIRIKFERHSVWDHCLLPDYLIPLTDCDDVVPYDCT